MKILIISQYFSPENFGINDIAFDLCNFGHEVTVLTGLPNYPSGRIAAGYKNLRVHRELIRGVKVVRVPLIARGNGSFWRLAFNYLSFAFTATIFAPFLLRASVDAIFVYQVSPLTVGLPAIFVSWLKRSPIVFWVQDLWPETLIALNSVKSKMVMRSIRWLAVFIYRRCSMILVQSQAFEKQIRALGVPNANIRYFPNTVPNYYVPTRAALESAERNLLPDGFKVIYAGNIGEGQDFETILDAAELLRCNVAIRWIIAGDGRRAGWLADQIAERKLEDNIRILGYQLPERMPELFALCEAALITLRSSSISALTIPSKLQTYLACGRPIIGGINGEAARIIAESQAGVICPPGKPEELADAVLALYRMSADKREEMGRSGRKYFEQHFERKKLMQTLIRWLKELASNPKTDVDNRRQTTDFRWFRKSLDQF